MNNKIFYLALLTLALTAGLILTVANRGVPMVTQTNLENLPMDISGFAGRDDFFDQGVYDVLQADLHVYRQYRSPDGKALSLYIGYYGTAKGGRTGHNPYACLPGAGWGIQEAGTVLVYPGYYPQGVEVNYVVAGKDGVNNVMLHWYQTAGTRVLTTGLQQNMQRFMGRVLHNRNDGAYVQVNTLVLEPEIPVALGMAKGFAREVLELLPEYWPAEG